MSAPKKGKDLSALKARLAKKAAEAESEASAAAAPPAADVPAPGEAAAAVPAPGEVLKPAAPVADIPAPGEVKKPTDIPAPGEVSKPADIPAPGEVRAPAPESDYEAAFGQPSKQGDLSGDPMSGGVAFDPNAGVIEDVGGEIKPRSSIGLPIFAGIIGVLIGVGLGWMAHRATESRSRVESAKKKGATIQERVEEIEKNRASLALKLGDAKDALAAEDPDKAIAVLGEIEPQMVALGDLFGWQMAAMPEGLIKNIFKLADANVTLQNNVGLLKSYVEENAKVLAERAKGPTSFVVVRTPEGTKLTEYVAAFCDEIPDPLPEDFKVESLKKCEGEGFLNPSLLLVREEIGGTPVPVPGNQAMILMPDGDIYKYAIGQTPDANAKEYFDIQMGRIDGVSSAMVKMHKEAAEMLEKYLKDPPVDGE